MGTTKRRLTTKQRILLILRRGTHVYGTARRRFDPKTGGEKLQVANLVACEKGSLVRLDGRAMKVLLESGRVTVSFERYGASGSKTRAKYSLAPKVVS